MVEGKCPIAGLIFPHRWSGFGFWRKLGPEVNYVSYEGWRLQGTGTLANSTNKCSLGWKIDVILHSYWRLPVTSLHRESPNILGIAPIYQTFNFFVGIRTIQKLRYGKRPKPRIEIVDCCWKSCIEAGIFKISLSWTRRYQTLALSARLYPRYYKFRVGSKVTWLTKIKGSINSRIPSILQ